MKLDILHYLYGSLENAPICLAEKYHAICALFQKGFWHVPHYILIFRHIFTLLGILHVVSKIARSRSIDFETKTNRHVNNSITNNCHIQHLLCICQLEWIFIDLLIYKISQTN